MSDTPESPQPEDARPAPVAPTPVAATPAAPAKPARPETPAAAMPAAPQKPVTPAAPPRPAAPVAPTKPATPVARFEDLAENRSSTSTDNFTVDEDDSPSKAGVLLDAVAAAVAIAFTALLLKDVLPFLS